MLVGVGALSAASSVVDRVPHMHPCKRTTGAAALARVRSLVRDDDRLRRES